MSRQDCSAEPDLELSGILEELWQLDDNRLQNGVHYRIDLQGRTRSYQRVDRAKDPLFAYVADEVLQRPTYKRFIALLDNYRAECGLPEVVTKEEVQENRDFIDAIMETKLMKRAHQYLATHKKVSHDVWDFKRYLYSTWFKLYRRTKGDRDLDSSAFEHVFVGECRNKEPIGFHNWIQFYNEEKAGRVDYQGYVYEKKPPGDNEVHLTSIQFSWKNGVKPVGSSMIGTSPEFEIALYTIVFLCGKHGDNIVQFGGQDMVICLHRLGPNIGSAYPKHHY